VKDAAAWLVRPKLPGEAWTFDYVGDDFVKNKFAEATRDCAFADDTLVMVGEARGKHDKGKEQFFDRHFLLRFDTTAKTAGWTVAGGQVDLQSGATTVVVDDQGRYLDGRVRVRRSLRQADDGAAGLQPRRIALFWKTQLGAVTNKNWGPHDLVWSPARLRGHRSGRHDGERSRLLGAGLLDRAARPLVDLQPRGQQELPHGDTRVAIGAFGEVYAGGLGNSGYPAVAYIGG
jgi:hypothetical protein